MTNLTPEQRRAEFIAALVCMGVVMGICVAILGHLTNSN